MIYSNKLITVIVNYYLYANKWFQNKLCFHTDFSGLILYLRDYESCTSDEKYMIFFLNRIYLQLWKTFIDINCLAVVEENSCDCENELLILLIYFRNEKWFRNFENMFSMILIRLWYTLFNYLMYSLLYEYQLILK